MRIAQIITRADDIGGAQTHVRDLSAALSTGGHEVTVLAGGTGEFFKQLAALGIPHRTIPHLSTAIHPARDLTALGEIVRVLRELKPEIVATHTAKAGFLGRMAASLLRIPAVFTPHGWSISDRISMRSGKVFRCAESISGLISSRIINVCEFENRLARKYRIARTEKLTTIYNGIPDIAPALHATVSGQPPRLVMIARFSEPKQHSLLLKALALLKELAWSLELIGDGPRESEVRAEAHRLGISDRVFFAGFRRDITQKLGDAQIFALISRFEAFPYSILEAMRAGLPVIASDVGGIPESVVGGHTGLLTPRDDVHALKDCLADLIVNP
ncbi:MAG: glycosyltransferase, partial [Acidobacteriaceae bacterium]|nr:glycosyltransferase [Acidobacteriaceae bacterium]